MPEGHRADISLLKNRQWSVIDGEPCRVIEFHPLGYAFRDGKVICLERRLAYMLLPYASVLLECKKLPGKVTGFICHKTDFVHLWMAVRERTVNQDEELIIFWSSRRYKFFGSLFALIGPKLWVMVCPRGAFELFDPSRRPELQGEARWNATKPIVDWKPAIMQ
jgi:hypothetical protein